MTADMTANIEVHLRSLTDTDLDRYRALRLDGLRKHTDCFRTGAEEEPATQLPTANTDESFTLGAFTDEHHLLGIVSFQRETRIKLRHHGLVFGMYVSDSVSGQGIGRRLMTELINRAKRCQGLEQLTLTVVATNTTAKKLYLSLGFTSFALHPRAIKVGENYLDEEQMILSLQA